MPSEVHVDPDALRASARAASALSEELWGALRDGPDVAVLTDERERLVGAVGAAVRELADLGAALERGAAAGSAAEADVTAALRRLRDALGPGDA